jgi:hypothetical protein
MQRYLYALLSPVLALLGILLVAVPHFFSLPARSSGYGCSAYAQVNHFQLLTSPPYTAPRGQDVQQITSQPHTIHAPVEDVSKVLKYYALRSIYRSLSLVAVGIHVRE